MPGLLARDPIPAPEAGGRDADLPGLAAHFRAGQQAPGHQDDEVQHLHMTHQGASMLDSGRSCCSQPPTQRSSLGSRRSLDGLAPTLDPAAAGQESGA